MDPVNTAEFNNGTLLVPGRDVGYLGSDAKMETEEDELVAEEDEAKFVAEENEAMLVTEEDEVKLVAEENEAMLVAEVDEVKLVGEENEANLVAEMGENKLVAVVGVNTEEGEAMTGAEIGENKLITVVGVLEDVVGKIDIGWLVEGTDVALKGFREERRRGGSERFDTDNGIKGDRKGIDASET